MIGQPFQTIIPFPQQIQRGWHFVPKQALIFTSTAAIHPLASIWPEEQPEITYIRGHGLLYMRVKLLLLYGFLEIVAKGNKFPTRLGMEFNTVAWYFLSLPLRCLLHTAINAPDASPAEGSYSPAAQRMLKSLPLKFSNGVKFYGLLPGEQLEELVFQPGLCKHHLHFFRRPVTANTLLMLTSNYMAVIQEELNLTVGWILSYIPRNCITEMQSRPCGLCGELIVRLKREDQTVEYNLSLTNEAIETWRNLWIQNGGQWQEIPAPEETAQPA